jgi:hypothetical protein
MNRRRTKALRVLLNVRKPGRRHGGGAYVVEPVEELDEGDAVAS